MFAFILSENSNLCIIDCIITLYPEFDEANSGKKGREVGQPASRASVFLQLALSSLGIGLHSGALLRK